ncbi:MAG: hypothetical protein HAW60_03090 [Bdellovibrionales bacterium]|nr:hypothetical protein [Bdellovibrionales bacterium]
MLLKKKISFIAIYIAVILLLSHLLYWRQYSIKALFLKSSFVLTKKKQNIYSLVGICNKLEYFSCSDFLLKYLLNKYPYDSLALFNLAYIEYKKNNLKLSKSYLQNYLSLKEDNIKAYLLYSKILQKLNKTQSSLDILYLAFSKKRDARLTQALVMLLNSSNNSTEALSFLFSIKNSSLGDSINFNGQHYNFLKEKSKKFDSSDYNSFAKLLNFSKKSFFKNLSKYKDKPKSLSLFSVRGGDFFIPMRLKNKTSKIQALKIYPSQNPNQNPSQNPNQNQSQISLTDLEENYFFLEEELIVGNKITIPNIFIGPWSIKNTEFKICKNCQSTLHLPLPKTKTKTKTKPKTKPKPKISYKLTKKYIFYFLNLLQTQAVTQ